MKKKNRINRSICILAILSIVLPCMIKTVCFASGTEPEAVKQVVLETAESYKNYRENYSGKSFAGSEIRIDASQYTKKDGLVEVVQDYKGFSGKSLLTPEDGFTEWTFSVQKPGLYNLGIDYYPVEGKSAPIRRSVWIDGKLPFEEARTITFLRVWQDVRGENGKSIQQDSNGNDHTNGQIETPSWQFSAVPDPIGYIEEPLAFYLSEGVHTLRFIAVQEPLLIGQLRFYQAEQPVSYKDVRAGYEKAGYAPATGEGVKIQAEEPSAKSDTMIVPTFDRSTSAVEPSDTVKLKLNTLGGTRWQSNGQWISWSFKVPETGLYKIAVKSIQNVNSGGTSARRIYIDGKIPFQELSDVLFPYSTRWQMNVLGGEREPYEFYFKEGETHEIKMEVCLGKQAGVVQDVSAIITDLNSIYRRILVITGSNPDLYRDYRFDTIMPETIADLATESKQLKECYDALTKINGVEGEGGQLLRQVSLQTQQMSMDPGKIAGEFSSFQNNISALGTWVNTAKQQPLSLDYLLVAPLDATLPKAGASFWKDMAYQWGSFLSSFVNDYNLISDSQSNQKSVRVWVGSGLTGGRDQAQILKNMTNNDFTNEKGIQVNLQLVAMDTLLPATLAGKGPDVALSLSASDACNYAFRGAVANLAEFDDFQEISSRFSASAMTPLTFQNGVYGLPETQTFPMLFYRKDIMSQLGLAIPQTWKDVIAMLPVLQKNQLNFGMPTASAVGSTITAYTILLYQNNGSLYSGTGEQSTLDSAASVEAFSFLTSLYKNYEIPISIDFVNRFRSGEVPIGIADYSTYNQLSVFAPELAGLWGFTSVPGIRQADGTVNRTVPGTVTASVMMEQCKDKQLAWEFMKWWTRSDSQVKFGRELESVMGTAARYPTANMEALYQIPWTKECFTELMNQWKSVKGIPEVPGGYYTPRYLDFAFRKSVYDTSSDPGEAITEAVKYINVEIENKRREFGLLH